jgi:hypothetical protein
VRVRGFLGDYEVQPDGGAPLPFALVPGAPADLLLTSDSGDPG